MPSKVDLETMLWIFPDLGVILWRVGHGRARALDLAGTVHLDGYRYIRLNGRLFAAHWIIWFYVHGLWPPWPEYEIDHIDRNKDNNNISNLRIVTHASNQRNRRVISDGHRFYSDDPSAF